MKNHDMKIVKNIKVFFKMKSIDTIHYNTKE